MKTAWVMNVDSFETRIRSFGAKTLLVLYFAEIDPQLNRSESRSFYIKINGERRSGIVTTVPNYSALELTFISNQTTDIFKYDIVKAINSTTRPIINAYQFYLIYDTQTATYSQDSKCPH